MMKIIKRPLNEIENYIERKVNQGNDTFIPYKLIPESLKNFWAEHYKTLKN
jgi:hypothetical protein